VEQGYPPCSYREAYEKLIGGRATQGKLRGHSQYKYLASDLMLSINGQEAQLRAKYVG
jgi:hypothetical protein